MQPVAAEFSGRRKILLLFQSEFCLRAFYPAISPSLRLGLRCARGNRQYRRGICWIGCHFRFHLVDFRCESRVLRIQSERFLPVTQSLWTVTEGAVGISDVLVNNRISGINQISGMQKFSNCSAKVTFFKVEPA